MQKDKNYNRLAFQGIKVITIYLHTSLIKDMAETLLTTLSSVIFKVYHSLFLFYDICILFVEFKTRLMVF